MPLYEFEDVETGERVEVFAQMADATPIGEEREIYGRRMRRVLSDLQFAPRQTVSFKSISLPDNWPHARHHDSEGRPYFTNKHEVQESVKRSQDTPQDAMVYDP